MELLVTLDFRFVRTPDGQVWTRTSYSYAFWDRYLKVFDRVKILARAEAKPSIDEHYKPVTGHGVDFLSVPFYLGPWQYLKARRRVRQAVSSSVGPEDAVLCRVASQLASDLLPDLWAVHRPYGLEVVGDPYEAFSAGAVKHPLRPYFRRRATRLLKTQCARAAAVSYVTEQALQRRYPCGNGFAAGVSDVDLQTTSFRSRPRVFTADESSDPESENLAATPKRSSGSVRPRLALCWIVGADVQRTRCTAARYRPAAQQAAGRAPSCRRGQAPRRSLEGLSRSLSLEDTVQFTGELTAGEAIRSEFDSATLMVLPSRTEGLPRVVVEAHGGRFALHRNQCGRHPRTAGRRGSSCAERSARLS